jgi:hypothetical protein
MQCVINLWIFNSAKSVCKIIISRIIWWYIENDNDNNSTTYYNKIINPTNKVDN